MDFLNQRDGLHVRDTRDEALQETFARWAMHYRPDQVGSSLMLANRNLDVAELNALARQHMQAIRALSGPEARIETLDRNGHSLGLKAFQRGDRVQFLKNAKLETGERVQNGATGTLDDVRLSADGRAYLLTIRCDSGKTVTVRTDDYAHLNHAYALTTYKSQGLTVRHVSVLAGGSMQDLNTTYVQLTRQTQNADLILPKPLLEQEMVHRPPTGLMLAKARALAARMKTELPLGVEENFWVCRQFLAGGSAVPVPDWAEDIRELLDAMRRERCKETTFDYESVAASAQVGVLPEPEIDMDGQDEGTVLA